MCGGARCLDRPGCVHPGRGELRHCPGAAASWLKLPSTARHLAGRVASRFCLATSAPENPRQILVPGNALTDQSDWRKGNRRKWLDRGSAVHGACRARCAFAIRHHPSRHAADAASHLGSGATRASRSKPMIPTAFDYVRAGSLAQAIDLLRRDPEGTKLVAGGHTLIPTLKLRLASPALLVDIRGIADMKGISIGNESIRIGALTTHAELLASEPLHEVLPIFRQAANRIADPQVRNRGTIGGSLANAD